MNSDKIENLFKSICEQARTLLKGDSSALFLLQGDKLVLNSFSSKDKTESLQIGNIYYNIGEGLTGYIAQQGKPFRLSGEEYNSSSRWKGNWDSIVYGDKKPTPSMIAVPILLDGKSIGVLRVLRNQKQIFTESEQKTLEIIAELISSTINSSPEQFLLSTNLYLFVLMPFSTDFKDIYELGIKDSANKLGMRAERVDEIEFNDRILEKIYEGIQRADIVIADMTGKNPNVFYEVGYAHALSKEVILLTQSAEDIPFDLKGHNHIVYNGSITTLKQNLEKRLRAFEQKIRKQYETNE